MLRSMVRDEKLMLDKQFLRFSLVILLLPWGPKCSSLIVLFGDFFILHYVIVGYFSTLIRFSEFCKRRGWTYSVTYQYSTGD